MKNLGLLLFVSVVFINCKNDNLEPKPIYPRTEYYVGTSRINNYILEVVLIDSMYHWLEHSIDSMFQDTLQLEFDKVDDEVQLNISYEDTELNRTLDASGNYYFFKAPKPTIETIIHFQETEKLEFKHYSTCPSPDQAGSYNNKKSFRFEGTKL